MKFYTLLFLIICCSSLQAQTDADVVGFYRLRGGSHYLKSDHTFVIIGYATFIVGTWAFEKKDKAEYSGEVIFTPYYEKDAFTIYGRQTISNKDSTKIMFSSGFYKEETFVHIGTLNSDKPTMKRLFKRGHNEIVYPYVYKSKEKLNTVSFSFLPYSSGGTLQNYLPEIYTFSNPKNYNDFIAIHTEIDRYNQPFTYYYKDNLLHYSSKHYGEKEDLDAALKRDGLEGDFTNFNKLLNEIYFTPKYKIVDADSKSHAFKFEYTFSESKNAYISKNYEEGQEYEPDFDYNNTSILYQYKRIENVEKSKMKFTIIQEPIFK
ncbi:hypothetical protein HNQ02_003296 [Flavobacterium sp. 7E]|uniref:hypothetical protein n=1 Tax=Flavobacterium sp. 7E TaxID=2735898 RepID=UPI00156E8915|nr:hypothetical protein [Flavobacterium sp. 7E]NRS90356.1 hypothetical protein [Flavobacterium sp. 7E]